MRDGDKNNDWPSPISYSAGHRPVKAAGHEESKYYNIHRKSNLSI